MRTVGVEPTCLAAHDPKSCLSANSNTSPKYDDTGGAAKLYRKVMSVGEIFHVFIGIIPHL